MNESLKKSLLKIGGQHLQIKENPKSKEKKRKKTFIEIIDNIKILHQRADDLHREFGIDTTLYEDNHYKIIEQLIIEYYGYVAAEAVFWWIYDAIDPREEDYHIEEEISGKKHIVRSTTQLYNTLKKLKLFKPKED